MKWNRFTIATTTQAEDLIGEMLSELGIEGIEIEDNVPLSKEDTMAMFVDILPELFLLPSYSPFTPPLFSYFTIYLVRNPAFLFCLF